jgi:hypothetical protein
MTGDEQDRDIEGQASHDSSGPPGLPPRSTPPKANMTVVDTVRDLREAAAALGQDLADEQPRRRLRRSVIRSIDEAVAQLAGSDRGVAPARGRRGVTRCRSAFVPPRPAGGPRCQATNQSADEARLPADPESPGLSSPLSSGACAGR